MAKINGIIIIMLALLSNIGIYATVLSSRSEPVPSETCIMSFVIPKSKVKSSCELDEKVRRRFGAVDVKMNMYKDEVRQLHVQLQKERQLCHRRIDVLEGKISTLDIGDKYYALEKRMENMEIILEKAKDHHVQIDKLPVGDVHRSIRVRPSAKKRDILPKIDDIESIVKPIVRSEIENYLQNITAIADRKKNMDMFENNAIMDNWLRNDQSYVEETGQNVNKSLHIMKELERLEAKLNETGADLVRTVTKLLTNVTIKKEMFVKTVENTSLDYSNHTFANNTDYVKETEKHDLKETVTVAEGGNNKDGTQNDQKHDNDFYVANLYTDELEDILRGEINTLLQSRMEEVVSLMRKQAVTLISAVDRQEKQLENVEEGQEEKMKRLQDMVQGIRLEISSLSRTVQDLYATLHGSVEEMKMNMTLAMPHRDQEMFSKVDEHRKKFRTLDRLYSILKQSLQHYRNESKIAYMDAQNKLNNLETNLVGVVSGEIYTNITSKIRRELERFNESSISKLNPMEASIRNLEDKSVLLLMDIKNLERRHKSKTGKLDEDYGILKNRVDKLNNQNRRVHDSISVMKVVQRQLQGVSNTTSASLSMLEIEFKLSMTGNWVEYNFDYDTTRTECFGKQYIRQTKYKHGRLAGVVLCSKIRYKIMLANNVDDTFANVGDVAGFGEDHCEFVGAKSETIIRLSPPAFSMKTEEGFARDHWGHEPRKLYLNFLRPSPAWYECGVTIP